jgi:integrase/recombinase XerC
MKISLILKGQPDQFDRYPVVIRCSDGQKRTFRKTSVLLTKDQFTRFKNRSHLPKERDLYARFLDCFNEKREEKKELSFFTYCYELLRRWQDEKSPETLRHYLSELSKIKRFKAEFALSAVTAPFLENYKDYCKALGNTNNTLWKTFKFMRVVMRRAHKERLVKENPFDIFEIPKYRDPKKQYLTEEQVRQIEAITDLPPEILFVKHWFLIGCYAGLRFGDMRAFDKKENIRHGRLILYTSKTGELVSLPFTDRLKALFAKVNYQPVTYTNVHFNRLLKQIDIGVPLSCHLSRHTFGTLCLTKGISLEATAKMMGHANIKTTAIYAQITGAKLDEEFKKFG